ncbi:MAG: DUF421 domain-containing protein [Oscillospiraceae bacterium]|nr:DUF421 domain-containing protein [Oscillospiraceae bacterium]
MLDTTIRTLLGFTVLLTLTRLLGKKQLSQLTIFTYITGIALGSLISEMILNKDVSKPEGVLSLVLWCLLVLLIEFVSLKSPRARVLMDGQPTIVIKKGLIVERALRKQRLNLDDLTMQLRLNEVFSVLEVEYAILEPNGAITVLKKAGQISAIPSEIISDGSIVHKNLPELGYTMRELEDALRGQGITDVKSVLYAELQQDRSLYIQKRDPPK